MFLRLRRGLPVLVPHEGLVTTSYGHVDDLCTNLIEMAEQPAVVGEILNITGQGCSSLEYVLQLADIVGVTPEVIEVPALVDQAQAPFGHLFKDRHHGILSVTRAASLGLTMERGFRVGHEETYEWFCSTDLVNAPDQLADPMWGAGYDFALEAQIASTLPALQ